MIADCTPKRDNLREGVSLFEFLRMTDIKSMSYGQFTNRSELIGYLSRARNVRNYDYFHIAGHGAEKIALEMPRGFILADEFPPLCFENKVVSFSACGLSNKIFMDTFFEVTGARAVVAAQNDVEFADAAIFHFLFYYLILHHGYTPIGAFDRTVDALCSPSRKGRVKGGWTYWLP
jgi:hypothetical protein